MRILVLTNMYPPHAYGGYEQSCQDVVESWRREGHEVLVLTSDVRVRQVADPPRSERALVHRDLHLYWDDHVIVNPAPWRRLRWERADERCLERALTTFRPDVVSVWAMGAMSMGLLSRLASRGVPVVLVVCDEWPVYGPMVDAWLRAWARRPRLALAVAKVSGLATSPPPVDALGPACLVSDFLRRAVRERSQWRFPQSAVVYSGIAAEEFPFRLANGSWRWRLLYVGRIDARKGVDTVVRALAELPAEATLRIVGRGDDRYQRELRQLAVALGVDDRVTFTSAPRSQLAQEYHAADVVVFPPVWEEPFGLVPLEAMSCGTAVVATPVGGAAEFLVDRGNCLTFHAGEPEALVGVLRTMAGDPVLREELIRGGRATAAELGVERLAEVLEAWHRWAARPDVAPPGDRVLPLATRA